MTIYSKSFEYMQTTVSQIVNLLGGKKILKREVNNSLDWVFVATDGLPIVVLRNIQNKLSFSNKEISLFIDMSESTFQRRINANAKLTKDESEKVIHLSTVIAKGLEVFENTEDFKYWLETKNMALGGKTPAQLLSFSFGREQIFDILGRIEHGIYS